MKHVGIICEYNPFHTGHARLVSAVREAQTVVCLMSGNFTQRGEAAILPPTVRAAMALEAGADLVLELPFPFAASSARHFATAGVRALGALGVDTLAFGSESGDVTALSALAQRTPEGDYRRSRDPSTGDAAAYFEALGEDVSSNDILALEYLRAIAREAPYVTPFAVCREGAGYRDTVIQKGQYPSATALRRALCEGEDVTDCIPEAARAAFEEAFATYGIGDIERLGPAMLALLRTNGAKNGEIADCGGGLADRLAKAAWRAENYRDLCTAAATKRYTDGRIRRALLYLLAGVRREDLTAHPVYLRLLAANAKGREFLAKTAKIRTVHVVTKPSDIAALGPAAVRQSELARIADGLFSLCFRETLTPHALQTAKPYLIL
ncbi:MAG: nucleotidyltransferase family protein [Clostridia bacterium]|nr:nucleotidyltransferase family protein [Clostridia bacterium]